jgi:hypothetical protein
MDIEDKVDNISIDDLAAMMKRSFDHLDKRADSIEKKIDDGFIRLDKRIDGVEVRLSSKINDLDIRMGRLEDKMA